MGPIAEFLEVRFSAPVEDFPESAFYATCLEWFDHEFLFEVNESAYDGGRVVVGFTVWTNTGFEGMPDTEAWDDLLLYIGIGDTTAVQKQVRSKPESELSVQERSLAVRAHGQIEDMHRAMDALKEDFVESQRKLLGM